MPLTQNSKLKTQNSTTDYHCHILPGVDDGAADLAESLAMARKLSAAGFTTICCTPHLIRGAYERSAADIRDRVEQLQDKLTADALPVLLLAGAEYYLDECLLALLDDPLPLGDSGMVLVEIPAHTPGALAEETCQRMVASGYTPLIAHPERCSLLNLEPVQTGNNNFWSSLISTHFTAQNSKLKTQNSKLLCGLSEMGCKFQGNIGSFAGIYGDTVRRRAEAFLQAGLYSHFGSDAHHADHLEDFLQKGLQRVAESSYL